MRVIASFAAALALTGCISAKSFVDPSFPKVAYDQLERRSSPLRVGLTTQFQRNGVPFPRADPTLKDNAERVLRASGVLLPVAENVQGQMSIVVNNIADMGSAAAKGFGTGLTFGLVGTTVTDAYEMTLTITVGDKTFTRTAVKHAIHTAVGNTTIPPGMETVPPQVAFERVLEQMILRVLKEYQLGAEGVARAQPAGSRVAAANVRPLLTLQQRDGE